MIQLIRILFFLFVLVSQQVFSQSIADIRRQKENSEKEINYLNKLLEGTKGDQSVSLGKLSVIQEKIFQTKRLISSLNSEVNYLQGRISNNESRIGELQSEKKSMLDLYGQLVYNTWKKRNKTNKLMFICSSSDFNQAYNRFKYFQQIQDYSKRQLKLIEQVNDSLNLKNQELSKLVAEKNETLNKIDYQNKSLVSEQGKEKKLIDDLKKREKELQKKLAIEARKRKQLNDKLTQLLAAQAKKSGASSSSPARLTPEEKLISNDFEKNKGRLPWPVTEGFISERFGINKVAKKVELENKGVDITTSKNASVRSVFQGTVIGVYLPDPSSYTYLVLIKHGNYTTCYYNLISVNVKEGQKVETKEVIGKVGFDDERGSVLVFQIWKNYSEGLNPELWLSK